MPLSIHVPEMAPMSSKMMMAGVTFFMFLAMPSSRELHL